RREHAAGQYDGAGWRGWEHDHDANCAEHHAGSVAHPLTDRQGQPAVAPAVFFPKAYAAAPLGAAQVTPACSKAAAARSVSASRQGAAISCTPIGKSPGLLNGAATIGKPIKDKGWV